jgi:hypothetical protein
LEFTALICWAGWTAADLSRPNEDDIERRDEGDSTDVGTSEASNYEKGLAKARSHIMINDKHIVIPDWLSLDAEERSMLEVFRLKLQEGLSNASSRDTDETHIDETVSS